MPKKILLISFLFILMGCAPGQVFGPDLPTPLPTYTSRPTSTAWPTATATFEPTATQTQPPTAEPSATAIPVCTSGAQVTSSIDTSLPGYIDIENVSTRLKGAALTVTITLSWLPDEILIDRNILNYGLTEIAWGVAIDADNDPSTGIPSPLATGYGYDYILQAVNYKEGEEVQDDLQTLFKNKANLWETYADGTMSVYSKANFKIDYAKRTITLSANIKGISKDSYLHYFALYSPSNTIRLADELCKR